MTCRTMIDRWREGYRGNEYFHRAVIKYGWNGFDHEILSDGLTKEQAEETERAYIALYDSTSREKGYNIELGGNSTGKHSEETKRKISESQKGRKFTEEHRRNLSVSHKGKTISQEQKLKISASLKGNKNTLGYHHSAETKEKMRDSQKGKHGKSVLCLTDGKTFKSAQEAADFYELSRHQVMNYCNGKTKHLCGSALAFAYV